VQVSVLARRYGQGVALACDSHGCGRKFFPKGSRPKDAEVVRERAQTYGWDHATIDGVVRDACPDHATGAGVE
jgi:hypothetical protein